MDAFIVAVSDAAFQIQLYTFIILGWGCDGHCGKEKSEDCKQTHFTCFFLDCLERIAGLAWYVESAICLG
jgi:hypothetical protein